MTGSKDPPAEASATVTTVAELLSGSLPEGMSFVFMLYDSSPAPGDGWVAYAASAVPFAYQAHLLRKLAAQMEAGKPRTVGGKGVA